MEKQLYYVSEFGEALFNQIFYIMFTVYMHNFVEVSHPFKLLIKEIYDT